MSAHLDERPLGEFLVDFGFVHDVLGSAGVFQRAQSLLRRDKEYHNHEAKEQSPLKFQTLMSQSHESIH